MGNLPAQLAVINNVTARCEELAVEGIIEKDAKKVYWACANDPLTSAVLSLAEIKDMVKDMFAANKDYVDFSL